MTLSRQEFTKIMSPIITLGLPKAGISSTAPTVMRYGPYVYRGCKRISYLLEHIWKDTPTGQLIQINLEDIHLKAGCGRQFIHNGCICHRGYRIAKDSVSQYSYIQTVSANKLSYSITEIWSSIDSCLFDVNETGLFLFNEYYSLFVHCWFIHHLLVLCRLQCFCPVFQRLLTHLTLLRKSILPLEFRLVIYWYFQHKQYNCTRHPS